MSLKSIGNNYFFIINPKPVRFKKHLTGLKNTIMNLYQENLKENGYTRSYLTLRLWIGLIGFLLPILLPLGEYMLNTNPTPFQSSISHYYFSKMHILFTGLLMILGAFLVTYKGKYKYENWLSTLAGFCAAFVAIFPTPIEGYLPYESAAFLQITQPLGSYVEVLHFGSAVTMFLCFMLISCIYFTKSDATENNVNHTLKKRRNKLYKGSALGIFISLVLALLFMKDWLIQLPNDNWLEIHATYFFESTALFCFALAWLIKGSFMWGSQGMLYKIFFQWFR